MADLAHALLDELADRVADCVAERLAARLTPPATDSGWLTSREAAEHLGVSMATLKRWTAARSIPFTQNAPGGRCYFKRADLDEWRRP